MFIKKIDFSVVIVLFIVLFTSIPANAATTNKRLCGVNRYATSEAVSLEGWTQSNYAVLAYGEDFPDALSAAPLAKKYNAPILLTQKDSLPLETINSLRVLKVKNVFIIGGTGVVSSKVETQLKAMNILVTRIFGQDRYETDIKVAEKLDNVSEITIATGEDYADALSISPIAAKKNMPIILTKHDEIPAVVKNYINNNNISKIYVIGAGSSLENSLLSNLSNTNIEQINGEDKYKRNISIIEKFKSDLDLSTLYVATGENFADALSGSILAGTSSSPMLLVGANISSQNDFYNKNFTVIKNIKILGGTGAVNEDIINNLTLRAENTAKEIHSFYPSGIRYGDKSEAFIKAVDSVSFSWSSLQFDTKASQKSIVIHTDYNNDSIIDDDIIKALKCARDNSKSTQLSIFADDSSSDTYKIVSSILPYTDKREDLINKITNTLQTGINIGESNPFKFNGVVIDFEGLTNGEVIEGKEISEYYVEFIKELRAKLDTFDTKQNLYVAANVKVNFTGYDYVNILKYADKLILMAHDYEPIGNIAKSDIIKYINYDANNNINSLAPINLVERALKDTTTGLDVQALNKIWLQISFDSAQWQFSMKDANDWSSIENNVISISHDSPLYSSIKARLDDNSDGMNLELKYINELQSPYITYYNKTKGTYNFILYEDDRSVKAKIDIANEYGIGGISLWQWGNVPAYDDDNGKNYYLDVWQEIQRDIR